MSFEYEYDFSDFTTSSGVINDDALTQEIAALELGQSLESVSTDEDTEKCTLQFEAELTSGDKTTLDGAVAAHSGNPPTTFKYLVPSKLVENTKDVTEDQNWQNLGGVVTTLSAFVSDVSKAWGRVIGQVKASGSGAQIRVIRDSDDTMLMAEPYSVEDTSGEWVTCQCWVNTNQPAATDCFILQGRLNGATSLQIRYVSMSLLEKLT